MRNLPRIQQNRAYPKIIRVDAARSGLHLVCVGGVRVDVHESDGWLARWTHGKVVRFAVSGAIAMGAAVALRVLLHAL